MLDMVGDPSSTNEAVPESGSADPNSDVRPELNINVVGAGISPADVPIPELARLLRAAAALLRALADEVESAAPDVAMVTVSHGSAAYAFQAIDPALDRSFEPLVESVHRAVAQRGRANSTAVRDALRRLYGACGRGALQVGGRVSGRALTPVVMAQPVDVAAPSFDATTTLHGRVIGVDVKGDGFEIWLKPRDGSAKLQLLTEDEVLAEHAGALFNQTARLAARYTLSPDGKRDTWELLDIKAWAPTSLLGVLDDIRKEVTSQGLSIDYARFRRALSGDEREDDA